MPWERDTRSFPHGDNGRRSRTVATVGVYAPRSDCCLLPTPRGRDRSRHVARGVIDCGLHLPLDCPGQMGRGRRLRAPDGADTGAVVARRQLEPRPDRLGPLGHDADTEGASVAAATAPPIAGARRNRLMMPALLAARCLCQGGPVWRLEAPTRNPGGSTEAADRAGEWRRAQPR